jgi:ribonuclease HI
MGMGIVIRNDVGNVVAAKAKYLPYLINPQTAEAMAAWYAFQFGRDMGGSFIILEGDSLEVVIALRRKVSANWVCGQLLDDIKTFFSHFNSVDVRHVRRDANKGAHVLAKCAISQLLDMVWVEECPPFIHSIVLANI